jgi:hypothetical protein
VGLLPLQRKGEEKKKNEEEDGEKDKEKGNIRIGLFCACLKEFPN